ncbi:hypothetical protein [Novosphingobium sp. M1R2S20]|uniref:Uncharacterized protein n=1 Tax=Novosphingobium rhizovicinum TaxID=3228928 RepID=A0ABV3R747_9SPHN
MAIRNRKRRTSKPALQASTAVRPAELKQFTNGGGAHPGFDFTRYWWQGEGPRDGITLWIRKKIRPGDDPDFGYAAKCEVLVPSDAPGDYADLDFLLERFNRTLPPFERHAFIQVKVTLDPREPWHAGYERVRAYARSHFARHAVILVAHVPGTAGLDGNGSHVHCVVLSRPLGINGFGGACHHLCSDKGHADAWAAWQAHHSLTATYRKV